MDNYKSHIAALSVIVCLLATTAVFARDTDNTGVGQSEFERALSLTPDIDNGRRLYKLCVACHGPESWGDDNGSYPQIAGQLPGVIIKQLADFRAGNRDNPIMRAFTSVRALGGAQEIADVAAYIASLPMTDYNGQGSRRHLALGKEIYLRDCADCHGSGACEACPKACPLP